MSGYFNAFHLKVMDLNLANVLCMHKPKYNYETKTRQNFSNYILALFKTELKVTMKSSSQTTSDRNKEISTSIFFFFF